MSCSINKNCFSQVLDFNWHQYSNEKWGKVYLGDYHGKLNQRFRLNGAQIFVKGDSETHAVNDLVLDVYGSKSQSGAKVGIYKKTGGLNQKWIMAHGCELIKVNFIALMTFS